LISAKVKAMIPKKISNRFRMILVSVTIALAMVLSLPISAHAQTGGTANYIYDDNGRLAAVISPTGEATIYRYDPAGNFTAIIRRDVNELSIIEFSPVSGAFNTVVTIYGTGFSTTPSANTVKFGSLTATVTAATRTPLTVVVPFGATTGPIDVTNANGTVTSSRNFVVAGSGIEFLRPINFGGSDQFEFTPPPSGQNNTNVGLLTFGATAGQRISLVVEDPLCGANSYPPFFSPFAQISIISPSGGVVASVPFENLTFPGAPFPITFAYVDASALTATGQYTIVIDPNDLVTPSILCGGRFRGFGATVRLYDVPPDITRTIDYGLTTPINFTSPGQKAVLTFNGLGGQRICLEGSQDVPTFLGTDVKIYAPGAYPSGTPLISRVLSFPNSFFVDTTPLTANGTYTILVDPELNKTRTTVLTLYDVPPDVTGTLTIGGAAQTINIPAVGQDANLTFNVPANQQVTIRIRDVTIGGFSDNTPVTLSTQSGTQIFTQTIHPFGEFNFPATLAPGMYVIKIDPQKTLTGSLRIFLTTP
jgi:YD repeat-containing protein